MRAYKKVKRIKPATKGEIICMLAVKDLVRRLNKNIIEKI